MFSNDLSCAHLLYSLNESFSIFRREKYPTLRKRDDILECSLDQVFFPCRFSRDQGHYFALQGVPYLYFIIGRNETSKVIAGMLYQHLSWATEENYAGIVHQSSFSKQKV